MQPEDIILTKGTALTLAVPGLKFLEADWLPCTDFVFSSVDTFPTVCLLFYMPTGLSFSPVIIVTQVKIIILFFLLFGLGDFADLLSNEQVAGRKVTQV